MQLFECEKCHKKTERWSRCKECHKCDGCGTREKICMYMDGVHCPTCRAKHVEKKIASFRGSTLFTSEVVCPWCGYQNRDSWEMGEGTHECGECERSFDMTRRTETTYTTTRTK